MTRFEEFLKRNPPLCKCPFAVCHGKEDTNLCKRDEIMKTNPKVIEGYEKEFGPMKRSQS